MCGATSNSSPNTSAGTSPPSRTQRHGSARCVGTSEQTTRNVTRLHYLTRSPAPVPEYISPYPPLPSSSISLAANASTATASTQIFPAHASVPPSATTVVAGRDNTSDVFDHEFDAITLPSAFQPLSLDDMFDARTITKSRMAPANARPDPQAQKQALIDALNEHRVNTLTELRRVERIFATLGSSDVTQPMTSAWMHYVNSNSLLSELRGLTRNYPFSSECLDEAKRRVHQDPASNRSWNYCWLVLAKVHTDKLIPTFARVQASRAEMWGGNVPPAESINKLTEAFVKEWSAALAQLLRYWEAPPIR